jgi:predicted transposase/invertase (TIGR01784 family)
MRIVFFAFIEALAYNRYVHFAGVDVPRRVCYNSSMQEESAEAGIIIPEILPPTDEEFDMLARTNKVIGEAVEELYEISADKETRAQYEYRLKAERDRLSAMNLAYKDGQRNGLIEGQRQGLIEGQRQGKLQTAQMLKEMGIPLPQIVRATGLSLEEIRQL